MTIAGGDWEAIITAVVDQEHPGDPDVALLARHVKARLRRQGMSVLAASEYGILSRSTLTAITQGADRVPSYRTLSKLDDLLSWEPGSAERALHGGEPIPREEGVYGKLPAQPTDAPEEDVAAATAALNDVFDTTFEDPSGWNYGHLLRWIDQRLRELNMTKSKFAAIGGPARATLATLGKRGFGPSAETLDRIDTFLLWERGSALTALRGGTPVRKGPKVAPNPALVPLNGALDTLNAVKVRLTRQSQSLSQLHSDVDEALERVSVAISELGDRERLDALLLSEMGDPEQGDAAGTGEIHD